MQWFIFLLFGAAVADSITELADEIVTTEQECERILALTDNINTETLQEQGVLYVELYFLCQDSLSELKYAYIDNNPLDLSHDSGEEGEAKFPVTTSNGVLWVPLPPERSNADVKDMKDRLSDYLKNLVDKKSPLHKLINNQSELGQQIVDQQVSCELLALLELKHPEDKDAEANHTECMDKLNCLKEQFMKQHEFKSDRYPEYFPILYKGRGTMINSPPQSDKSLCTDPVNPSEYKKELKKWNIKNMVQVIEKNTDEKLDNLEEIVDKLKKAGVKGPEPVLTKEELDHLMEHVKSVTIMDDDEDDDENSDEISTFRVYESEMLGKLAELEAKGVDIAHNVKNEAVSEITPKLQNLDSLAATTGEQLKQIEANKIKPAIKKTIKGLSDAEYKMKKGFGKMGDDMAFFNTVGQIAANKLKEDGSIFLDKLTSKRHGDTDSEEDEVSDKESHKEGLLTSITDQLVHSEYLPKNFDNLQNNVAAKLLKQIGRKDDEMDDMTDDEIAKMVSDMRANVKNKAKALNLGENDVKQAASMLKNVMHSILNAAKTGEGVAKDMDPDEIDHAKSLVDQLVDFATAEIVQKTGDEDFGVDHVVKKDKVVHPLDDYNSQQDEGHSEHVLNDTTSNNENKAVDDAKNENMDDETSTIPVPKVMW